LTSEHDTPTRSDAGDQRARWMALAQQGDQAAYAQLLEDLDRYVRRVLRGQMRPGEDLDDASQEVLLTMHRAMRTYDASRPFEPWFHALVRHALASMRRRRRREPATDPMGDEGLAVVGSRDSGTADIARAVDAALERLPPAQRDAVRLLKLDGLSVDEAAERIGISPGNLRVRAHRGYQALRRLLGFGE